MRPSCAYAGSSSLDCWRAYAISLSARGLPPGPFADLSSTHALLSRAVGPVDCRQQMFGYGLGAGGEQCLRSSWPLGREMGHFRRCAELPPRISAHIHS